jgi:hypothetical protein
MDAPMATVGSKIEAEHLRLHDCLRTRLLDFPDGRYVLLVRKPPNSPRIFALCNRCDGALMERPAGESDDDPLRVDFDRRPRLDFHGSAYPARLGLPPIPNSMTSSARRNLAGAVLSDVRKGKKYRAPAD